MYRRRINTKSIRLLKDCCYYCDGFLFLCQHCKKITKIWKIAKSVCWRGSINGDQIVFFLAYGFIPGNCHLHNLGTGQKVSPGGEGRRKFWIFVKKFRSPPNKTQKLSWPPSWGLKIFRGHPRGLKKFHGHPPKKYFSLM